MTARHHLKRTLDGRLGNSASLAKGLVVEAMTTTGLHIDYFPLSVNYGQHKRGGLKLSIEEKVSALRITADSCTQQYTTETLSASFKSRVLGRYGVRSKIDKLLTSDRLLWCGGFDGFFIHAIIHCCLAPELSRQPIMISRRTKISKG